MGMMDLYTEEQAAEALADAQETKRAFYKEIESINEVIFLLTYYLATGEALDPAVFGIEPDGEEDLDD